MEEYENLKAMVQIEIEKKSFEMHFVSNASFTWVKKINSATSGKGDYYTSIRPNFNFLMISSIVSQR